MKLSQWLREKLMRGTKPQKMTMPGDVLADLCPFCFPSVGFIGPDGVCQQCQLKVELLEGAGALTVIRAEEGLVTVAPLQKGVH